MPNRHAWSLLLLAVTAGGCGGRGCRGDASARNDRRGRAATTAPVADAGRATAGPSNTVAWMPSNATPVVSATIVGSVRQGANLFGLELYNQLRTDEGNLVVAAGPVSASLAMVSGGARGDTLAEMRRVLHHTGDDRALHRLFGDVIHGLRFGDPGDPADPSNAVFSRFAHRVFVAPGNNVSEFIELTMQVYGSAVDRPPFSDPAGLQARVNGFVSGQTDERVADMVPDGALTAEMKMLLVEALYFRAGWRQRFNPAMTRTELFQGTRTVQAPMMHGAQLGSYVARDGVKVAEVPLSAEGLVLDLVVPDAANGLQTLEHDLTESKLQGWFDALTPARIELAVPRFTFHPQGSTSLKATLQSMGMNVAFDGARADFSGLSPASDRVFLGDVFQRLFFSLAEAGNDGTPTRTSMFMPMPTPPPMPGAAPGDGGAPAPDPLAEADAGAADAGAPRRAAPTLTATVRADHGFFFVVRDERSGIFVLIGRVTDPTS